MTNPAPNWYPDPSGRHELRYWDGTAWTDQISDHGVTGTDPASKTSSTLDSIDSALTLGDEGSKVAEQISATGRRGIGQSAPVAGGTGSIFDEPILVVNQKVKLIELNNQYSVFNQTGDKIANVNQTGQSAVKKLFRLVAEFDQFMTHHLEIADLNGQVVLQLTRPRKFIKSAVIVSDGANNEIGRVVQDNVFGKIRFKLEANGQTVGMIKAENWRAWDFRIEDNAGVEIARITKTWEGLAKTLFTTADNYVVQIHQRPADPLNSLIVASALSIDTALKQDSRGLN
ncbi:MAG: scramblase [Ilumatobacter coccineus]|uniref:Scramblase n=1 Tax=Ilumatobacter coccineus TaxID=467094 RepID=A0A2G6K6E9_9ACTN|nr:MAG: scramblase [Ilumatobacter coccineus]